MGSMFKVPKMRKTEQQAEYQVMLFRKSLERKEFQKSAQVIYLKDCRRLRFSGSRSFYHSAGVHF